MSDSNSNLGEKMIEAGISSMKASADEIKTSVTTAIEQVTGQQIKSDQELQQIAQQDKESSGKRINEIEQELATQKRRHFQEVSSWNTPIQKSSQNQQRGPNIPETRQRSILQSAGSQQTRPLSVQQAVGKSEQGRNFKG